MPKIQLSLYTVDLVIFACLCFREFPILGLFREVEFANYQFQ